MKMGYKIVKQEKKKLYNSDEVKLRNYILV